MSHDYEETDAVYLARRITSTIEEAATIIADSINKHHGMNYLQALTSEGFNLPKCFW